VAAACLAFWRHSCACLAGKVCRYERFTREPGLKTALAYEAIFQKPISKLFPGLYEKIQSQVKARAQSWEAKNSSADPSRLGIQKRQKLAGIASLEPDRQLNPD
jgi:hypothetical protein